MTIKEFLHSYGIEETDKPEDIKKLLAERNMNDYEKTVAYNYVEQLENVLAHDSKLTSAACNPDVEPFLEENHKYLFNPSNFYFTTESDSLMTAVENTYAMLKKVLLLILLWFTILNQKDSVQTQE